MGGAGNLIYFLHNILRNDYFCALFQTIFVCVGMFFIPNIVTA